MRRSRGVSISGLFRGSDDTYHGGRRSWIHGRILETGHGMAIEIERARRFTADEFERMVELGIFREDERLEVIDGGIVEMAPVGDPHGLCVSQVNKRLVMVWATARSCGSTARCGSGGALGRGPASRRFAPARTQGGGRARG